MDDFGDRGSSLTCYGPGEHTPRYKSDVYDHELSPPSSESPSPRKRPRDDSYDGSLTLESTSLLTGSPAPNSSSAQSWPLWNLPPWTDPMISTMTLTEDEMCLASDEQKAAFFKQLAENILSDPVLYKQFLQHTESLGAVQDAMRSAQATSKSPGGANTSQPVTHVPPTNATDNAQPTTSQAEESDPYRPTTYVSQLSNPTARPQLLSMDEDIIKEHPTLANIVPLRGVRVRTRKDNSKIVAYYVDIKNSVNEAERIQEIFAKFDSFSHSHSLATSSSATSSSAGDSRSNETLPPILVGLVNLRDKKGVLLGIDDLTFFSGILRELVDRSIEHYQCYCFSENSWPEAKMDIIEELYKEINVINLCMKKALQDLNVTSYEVLYVLLTFQFGIVLAVFSGHGTAHSLVKNYMRKAIVPAFGLHPPRRQRGEDRKAVLLQHNENVKTKAIHFSEKDHYVQLPDDALARYTHIGYSQTAQKVLYSDAKKIGRLFPLVFGKYMPDNFMALLSVSMQNTLEELTTTGSCTTKEFQCILYFGEHESHKDGVKEVRESLVHGPLYKRTVESWAQLGSKPLPSLKGPLRKINLELLSAPMAVDEPLATEDGLNVS